MTSQLDIAEINAMIADQFPGTRNRCVELGPDYAVAAYDVTPADIRPGGFVSGPTQFAIADSALWFLAFVGLGRICLLYTSPSPRDGLLSRMPSSACKKK